MTASIHGRCNSAIPGGDATLTAARCRDVRRSFRAELPALRLRAVTEPDRYLGRDGRAGTAGAAPDALGHRPWPGHRRPVCAHLGLVAVRGLVRRPLLQTSCAARDADRARPGIGR